MKCTSIENKETKLKWVTRLGCIACGQYSSMTQCAFQLASSNSLFVSEFAMVKTNGPQGDNKDTALNHIEQWKGRCSLTHWSVGTQSNGHRHSHTRIFYLCEDIILTYIYSFGASGNMIVQTGNPIHSNLFFNINECMVHRQILKLKLALQSQVWLCCRDPLWGEVMWIWKRMHWLEWYT